MASICGSPVCAGGKPKMKFTYTGDYVVRKDGVVELLTSGTIVFLEPKVIDVFMVGGGGSGWTEQTTKRSGFGGGGGGYTRTVRRVNVSQNTAIEIIVGAGGLAPNRPGGSSGFANFSVNGGSYNSAFRGSNGGSGGGGGVASNSDYGAGGSDGNNGENGYPSSNTGGVGQGFTTREFGEATGKLYAGGGGGGRYMSSQTPIISMGGDGGGGSGSWIGASSDLRQAAAAGVANTGGGGGGGASVSTTNYEQGASGGSGIVCFRESVELPELAGTWVMNNRIYQPEATITELVNFTMPGYTVASYNAKGLRITGVPTTTASYFGIWRSTDATENYLVVYDFYTNKWSNTKDKAPAVLTFPVGATASNEFHAWLASNATKQA